MDWVQWLLIICMLAKFTGLHSSSVRTFNLRDANSLSDVSSGDEESSVLKSKRSVSNEIDDVDGEDLMTAFVRKDSPIIDMAGDSNNDNLDKKSSIICKDDTANCPSQKNATTDPAYGIDFSIGEETPISMERSDELMATTTDPVESLGGDTDVNLMIESPDAEKASVSRTDIANISVGVSREKRESSRNDKDAFLSEIETLVRNVGKEMSPGASEFAEFESSPEDDLMTADLRQQTASLISTGNPIYADEHESKLTATATTPEFNEEGESNNMPMLKVHRKKHSSYTKKKHYITPTQHKKPTKKSSSSKQDLMFQKTIPVSNHRHSELMAKSSSPDFKHARNSKISKRSKIETPNGELKSIFSEMHQATHKLTRSDIRKLAKTAVMLAALKSQNKNFDSDFLEKRHSNNKGKHTKRHKKKRGHKKHKRTKHKTKGLNRFDSHIVSSPEGMSFNANDPSNQPEISVHYNNKDESEENGKKHDKPVKELNINIEQAINDKKTYSNSSPNSEFIEDIALKKKNNTGVSDDAMVSLITKTADEEQKRYAIHTTPAPGTIAETTSTTSTTPTPIHTIETTTTPTTTTTTTKKMTNSAFVATIPKPAVLTTPTASTLTVDTTIPKDISVKVIADSGLLRKKSTVTKPDDDIDKAISDFDTNDLYAMTDTLESEKKSSLPSTEISDNMASLRAVLSKVNPKKVPSKFLPDLPSGLRMIAWKRLIEKKRNQLSEYEAAYGGAEAASDTEADKPVTINIDLDPHKISNTAQVQEDDISYTKSNDGDKVTFAKVTPAETDRMKDLDRTSDESATFISSPDEDDGETARHVHYLKKHIQGARSLRRLIAKTLVGHCKSTGRRILSAFIAMDKALERAQAIATVIGGKFNVDPSKIENLVTDKEDQVVETFLRDIFTKL